MPSAKPESPKPVVDTGFDANDDKPVLIASTPIQRPSRIPHLHPIPIALPCTSQLATIPTANQDPAPDPDRPTIHKDKTAAGPEDPVLHKHDDVDTNEGGHAEFH